MTAPRRAASARRSKADKAAAAPSIDDLAPYARTPAAPPETPAPLADPSVFDGQYRIKLESFEGPLDLLLHLIQQHELDILDIPVSFITAKYLEYLKLMQVLSIEIASEYLVMAATLVHIKSKMLLPVAPTGQDDGMPQEEEEDPRAELVRRLLEYQKYKAAAAELAERGTLGRDVFARGVEEAAAPGPAEFAKVEVFGLLEAFEKVLKRTKVKIDHEVVFDRISITDRIVELVDRLQGRRAVRFEWLFLGAARGSAPTRFDLVITFLAMLEMCRMKLLRVYQTGPLAPIYMGLMDEVEELSEAERAQADATAEETLSRLPETTDAPETQPAELEPAAAEPEVVGAEPEAVFVEGAAVPEDAGADERDVSGDDSSADGEPMSQNAIGPDDLPETAAVLSEAPDGEGRSELVTEPELERPTLPMISPDDAPAPWPDREVDSERATMPGPLFDDDPPAHEGPARPEPDVAEGEHEEAPPSDEVTDDG